MKKYCLFSLCLILCSVFNVSGQQSRNWTIYFASDQSSLDQESQKVLQNCIQLLDSLPAYQVYINGHTDNRGSQAYNLSLSRRRAQTVRRFLNAGTRDTLGSSLDAHWFSQPVASNQAAVGRSQNRRVEITIKELRAPEQVPEAISEVVAEKPSEELPTEVMVDANGFAQLQRDCRQLPRVIGRKGVEISFSENICDSLDLNLHLTEILSAEAIRQSGISTVSNGQLLRSGGMVRLAINSTETIDGCIEVKIPALKIEGARPYFSLQDNARGLNWDEMDQNQMRYDEAEGAYIFTSCGASEWNLNCTWINIDVPVKTGWQLSGEESANIPSYI